VNRLAGVDGGAAPFGPVSSSVVAARIAAATLAALAIGAAGSRGLPLPASADLYEWAITATRDAPAWIGHTFEVVSEVGLIILAGALLFATWRRRRSAQHVARSLATGAGVVLAYISSEGLKAVIAQPRPCLGSGATVASCPPATDWSLPSNHATIGMAMAVALVLTVPRSARWAVPIALAVAISRVAIGVHYPHDVGSGMLLAAAVVTATTLAFQPPLHLAVARAMHRWRAHRPD